MHMEKPDRKSLLPEVVRDDLLALVLEEFTDSNHIQRWVTFAEHNRILAQEILERAYVESMQIERFREGNTEVQKAIIDTVTFAIRALEIALLRERKQEGDEDYTQ